MSGDVQNKSSEYYSNYYRENREHILEHRREKYSTDKKYADRQRIASRKYRALQREEQKKRGPRDRKKRGQMVVDCNGDEIACLTVGMLSRSLERSIATIDYWTRLGLFPETPIRSRGGFRLYTDEMADVVKKAVSSRGKVSPGDKSFHDEIVDGWRCLGVYE